MLRKDTFTDEIDGRQSVTSTAITLNRFRRQEASSMYYMTKKALTVRCWKSHALRMFVATLGKIPRFFWFFLPDESSSSSPVPSPLPILALLASPATVRREPRSPRAASVKSPNSSQKNSWFIYFFFFYIFSQWRQMYGTSRIFEKSFKITKFQFHYQWNVH